jgi:type I restriction enzyme S subunit
MGSSPSSKTYNQEGCGLPLIQGNGDIDNRVSRPRVFTSQVTEECKQGDILFSVRAPVGAVSVSKHHACIGRGIAAINAKPSSSTRFIYQLLLSLEPKWVKLSQGSTFDAVNSTDIKRLSVYIPSDKEEQMAIAKLLDLQDDDIFNLEAHLDVLKREKQTLMQQLLTGQKRVKLSTDKATKEIA